MALDVLLEMKRYLITQLDELESIKCSCGHTKRGFTEPDNEVATVHLVDISKDSKAHYHKRLTEIYLILEGEGYIELDGELYPVKPMTSVLIKPGCRHRAIGEMRIANIPIPAFDPEDEWFD